MRNCLLTCLLLLTVSCKTNTKQIFEPQENDIVITGKLVNYNNDDDKVIKANFFNPFDLSDDSRSAKINAEDGTFRISYKMPYETDFTIDYYNFIYLLGGPGDSIDITIDVSLIKSDNFLDAVKFGGDKAGFNNAFWKCENYMYKVAGPILESPDTSLNTLSSENFMRKIDDVIMLVNDSLDHYAKNNNAPEQVVKHVKQTLLDLIAYYWVQEYNPDDPAMIKKIFNYAPFDMWNADNLNRQMFTSLLDGYVYKIIISNDEIYNLFDKQQYVEAIDKGLKLIADEPPGFIRDYIVYSYLASFAQDGDTFPVDSVPSHLVKSPYVKRKIEELITPVIPVFDDINVPEIVYQNEDGTTEVFKDVDIIDFLNKRYPDKLLYVDLCATWCGPCKKEFKPSRDLHEQLKDDEVQFVYLFLKSSTKNWLSTNETYSLKNSYYLNSDGSKLIMPGFKMRGFPTYMLVDSLGKVITNNAPRPSGDETFDFIKKHLYNK